ncbi:hypothetical protein LMG29542_08087 [Paraburkholderia humisilvae]|uniref:Transposase DDE domain-containing protein n=1 Tax=Paraburkholderia humisilvae TaxID=627669 RepID=A0A6J5F7D5_9BURK|nr:hypothetical protein LMG29542_08087 [Paraburkholderia humisilvae]
MPYRTRNVVERFFNRIKHFRRLSTRYGKLAHRYLVLVSPDCTFGAIRDNLNRAWFPAAGCDL